MLPVQVLRVMLPIFIIGLIGFIFGRYKKLDLKTLADFIIYISTPALALSLLATEHLALAEIYQLALAAVFVILGLGALTLLVARLLNKKVPAGLYLPIMFMNSGFIGYPLALFTLGTSGLSRAIIYDIINAALIFTVGIFIASQGKDRWQLLKMPFIYAALIGFLLSFLGIRLPTVISTPLHMLGNTTIPLALFILGYRLADLKIPAWTLPLIAAIIRIGGGLILGLLFIAIFKLSGLTAKIVILISVLPSAATTVALAEEYNSDADLVASTIALSTFLAILALPFVLQFFILNP